MGEWKVTVFKAFGDADEYSFSTKEKAEAFVSKIPPNPFFSPNFTTNYSRGVQ